VAKAVGIVGNPLQTTVTLREAKRSFKAADEEYQMLKLRAPMKCEEFCTIKPRTRLLLQQFESALNKHWDTNASMINARRMKHLRGKQRAGAITKVGVCQGDDYFEYEDQATV
jgi:hypothetical protein